MNRKGFFAISIIFSFFIVFLMILIINLTAYSQNRILLSQVKKDIKSQMHLYLPGRQCKRINQSVNDPYIGEQFNCYRDSTSQTRTTCLISSINDITEEYEFNCTSFTLTVKKINMDY